MALKPLHGINIIHPESPHAKLRDLLVRAYNASRTGAEQQLVRALGQAYFGVDMLYEALPGINRWGWPI